MNFLYFIKIPPAHGIYYRSVKQAISQIIDDTNISAGTYTLFTIPEENQVTVIINSATTIWGAYSYKSEKDVIRVKVPLVKSDESLEALSITFSNENEQPKIHFGWEYMRFELPFDVL